MKTLVIFLSLIFSFTQLNSQVQTRLNDVRSNDIVGQAIFEDEYFVAPHSDSFYELMEGMDVQYFPCSETLIPKSQNYPHAFSKSNEVRGLFREKIFSTPKVFDTNIKNVVQEPLAKTADTSHANDFWYYSNGPYGAGVTALALNSRGNIFVGTKKGEVYYSTNSGEEWEKNIWRIK